MALAVSKTKEHLPNVPLHAWLWHTEGMLCDPLAVSYYLTSKSSAPSLEHVFGTLQTYVNT